jgi:hypothetical protein
MPKANDQQRKDVASVLAKLKHLQNLHLIVPVRFNGNDFCGQLEIYARNGTRERPPLNEDHARAVVTEFFEEALANDPDAALEQLSISFRRYMYNDRVQGSTQHCSIKASRKRGEGGELQFVVFKEWQGFVQ